MSRVAEPGLTRGPPDSRIQALNHYSISDGAFQTLGFLEHKGRCSIKPQILFFYTNSHRLGTFANVAFMWTRSVTGGIALSSREVWLGSNSHTTHCVAGMCQAPGREGMNEPEATAERGAQNRKQTPRCSFLENSLSVCFRHTCPCIIRL